MSSIWEWTQQFPVPFLLQLLHACCLVFINTQCSIMRSTQRSSIAFIGNSYEFSMNLIKKEYLLARDRGCMHFFSDVQDTWSHRSLSQFLWYLWTYLGHYFLYYCNCQRFWCRQATGVLGSWDAIKFLT